MSNHKQINPIEDTQVLNNPSHDFDYDEEDIEELMMEYPYSEKQDYAISYYLHLLQIKNGKANKTNIRIISKALDVMYQLRKSYNEEKVVITAITNARTVLDIVVSRWQKETIFNLKEDEYIVLHGTGHVLQKLIHYSEDNLFKSLMERYN